MSEQPARVARSASPRTLDAIVAVHEAAFPGFFMTQLGRLFLREYYRCVVHAPRGILLTQTEGDACIGFVAGFVDPAAFYQELRRRRVRLGLAALAGVARRPLRFMTLLANYRRAGAAAKEPTGAATAELSSLGIVPAAAGKGIGSRLVRAFIDVAAKDGAQEVVLTTDAENNDAVNRFYQRLGFLCTRRFEARPGRWLNEYAFVIRKD